MASLTGKTISSTYDGLLKTTDDSALTSTPKLLTDGLGNSSGVAFDTNGNITIEGDFKALGGIKDSAGNLGTDGQVLASDGTLTEWIDVAVADDSVTYAKIGAEFKTSAVIAALDVDFATAQVFTKTLTADTTLTFSNASIGMVKDLVISGDFALTLPSGTTVAGVYDGTVSNLIQIVVTGAAEYWYSISKSI
jgi:hypothetical protein